MFRLFDLPASLMVRFDTKHKTQVTLDHIRIITHQSPLFPYGSVGVSKSQKIVVFENKDVGDGACFMMIL